MNLISGQFKLSHQFLFHLGLDVPRQSEEGLLHIYGRLGGCLHELDSVLDGELLSPLFGHLKMPSIKHYVRRLSPVNCFRFLPSNKEHSTMKLDCASSMSKTI